MKMEEKENKKRRHRHFGKRHKKKGGEGQPQNSPKETAIEEPIIEPIEVENVIDEPVSVPAEKVIADDVSYVDIVGIKIGRAHV